MDGFVRTVPIVSAPKECFLMTSLANVPPMANQIRAAVVQGCNQFDYGVADAVTRVTGRDFLLKIWLDIASRPLAVGIIVAEMEIKTLENIFYEIGVAQALGKETVIVKSPDAKVPSDFVRTEYIDYDSDFGDGFARYMRGLSGQADYYLDIADNLDGNPILALDYMKRAYLLTGDKQLREKALTTLQSAIETTDRAKDSVENLLAGF